MKENDFPLELDHVLVWVSTDAPEAKTLEEFGLKHSGVTRSHAGQGTSSIVFVFENAYLELIWVNDLKTAEIVSKQTCIDLLTRADWKNRSASPFGVALRQRTSGSLTLPLSTTKYTAEWLRPDTFIHVAEDSSSASEPLYFVIPDYLALPVVLDRLPDLQKSILHPLEVKRLTDVKITINSGEDLTNTACMLSQNGIATIEPGAVPLLELTFDRGMKQKSLDARPLLPIVLKY